MNDKQADRFLALVAKGEAGCIVPTLTKGEAIRVHIRVRPNYECSKPKLSMIASLKRNGFELLVS